MRENLKSIRFLNKVLITSLLMASCLALLSACSTTQKVAITKTDANCAFLGKDCSLLKLGSDEEAGLLYKNPEVKWRQYKKILIGPVTFWAGESSEISSADQQMLVNYLSQQLNEQIGQKIEIVTQPGVDVIKLDVALTDAKTATPVMRSMSMLIPQLRPLAGLYKLGSGSLPFVGAAQGDVKMTDSLTGQVLALAVDKQIGGNSFSTGFQWQWGDVENAIDHWAELIANKLSALN